MAGPQDQSDFLMIPPGSATTSRTSSSSCGDPEGPRGLPRRRPDLPVAALRDCGDHDRLHQAGRGGWRAHRSRRLQRVSTTPLRGPRDHHRVLPGRRDGAAEHQPAPPHLSEGPQGGHAHAADFPHVNFRRGDHRAPGRGLRHRLRHRRQGEPAAPRARTSRACGSTSSLATSTGSSAITPAARRR